MTTISIEQPEWSVVYFSGFKKYRRPFDSEQQAIKFLNEKKWEQSSKPPYICYWDIILSQWIKTIELEKTHCIEDNDLSDDQQ